MIGGRAVVKINGRILLIRYSFSNVFVMAKALVKGKLNLGALTGLERFMLAQLTIPDRVPTMLAATNVEPALIDNKYDYRLLASSVEANLELGFMADKRDYGIGAQICRDLGLRDIRILTNNPKKIDRLEVYGIKIVEQIPLRAEPSEHNIDYLRAKKNRFGHLLDEDL